MSDGRPPIEALLSDTEREAIVGAQNQYGGQAKLAAAQFAEAIGVDSQTVEGVVGGVALQLDGLNAGERRDVETHFLALAALLGPRAVATSRYARPLTADLFASNGGGSAVILPPTDEKPSLDVDLAAVAQATPKSVPPEDREPAVEPSVPAVATASPSTAQPVPEISAPADVELADSETAPPLSTLQLGWLSKLLPEADVDRIEALPLASRLDFARQLGNLYKSLPITGPVDKATQVAQMQALMLGRSINEIVLELGSTYQATHQGLAKMAESIAKRVKVSRITSLIPELTTMDHPAVSVVEKVDPMPTCAPEASVTGSQESTAIHEVAIPLTKLQRNWLEKLIGGERREVEDSDRVWIARVGLLTDPQREQLADTLEIELRKAFEGKDGRPALTRRVRQVTDMIKGKSVPEIAEALSMPEKAVNGTLHMSALKLYETVGSRATQLIQEAADSSAE